MMTCIFCLFLQVTKEVKDDGWGGKDDMDEAALQWSFAGALLYAVIVITTIGKTQEKIVDPYTKMVHFS